MKCAICEKEVVGWAVIIRDDIETCKDCFYEASDIPSINNSTVSDRKDAILKKVNALIAAHDGRFKKDKISL